MVQLCLIPVRITINSMSQPRHPSTAGPPDVESNVWWRAACSAAGRPIDSAAGRTDSATHFCTMENGDSILWRYVSNGHWERKFNHVRNGVNQPLDIQLPILCISRGLCKYLTIAFHLGGQIPTWKKMIHSVQNSTRDDEIRHGLWRETWLPPVCPGDAEAVVYDLPSRIAWKVNSNIENKQAFNNHCSHSMLNQMPSSDLIWNDMIQNITKLYYAMSWNRTGHELIWHSGISIWTVNECI